MTRSTTPHHRSPTSRQAVAARFIGFGGMLVLMPLLFVRSPFSPAMRAFAPFGWLVLLIGFGLLMVKFRQPIKARVND